jgi:hypothetical protein
MKTQTPRRAVQLVIAVVGLGGATLAQETPSPTTPPDPLQQELDQKVNAIEERAKEKVAEFEKRGEELGNEANAKFKLDITVRWKNRDLSLDLPQVAMKTKKMSMDAPQVTMRTKNIVFHTPSVRMVNKKTGQYPEFHGFTVRWKDIITKVPETFMQKQEISMDIPEFRYDRTNWSMDIPEVKMKRTNFVMKLPEFRVGDIQFVVPIDNSDMKQKAEDLKADALKFAADVQAEADALAVEYKQKFMARGFTGANETLATSGKALAEKKAEIEKVYDDKIAIAENVLSEGKGKLSSEDVKAGETNKAQLVAKRKEALAQVEGEQRSIESSQQKLKTDTEKAASKGEAEATRSGTPSETPK